MVAEKAKLLRSVLYKCVFISVQPLMRQGWRERKHKREKGEMEEQQTGCGGITGAGLQGELLAGRITGSSMGDM